MDSSDTFQSCHTHPYLSQEDVLDSSGGVAGIYVNPFEQPKSGGSTGSLFALGGSGGGARGGGRVIKSGSGEFNRGGGGGEQVRQSYSVAMVTICMETLFFLNFIAPRPK